MGGQHGGDCLALEAAAALRVACPEASSGDGDRRAAITEAMPAHALRVAHGVGLLGHNQASIAGAMV